MHPLKTSSVALAGIALLLLVLVQFLPWASYHVDGGSFFGTSFPDSEIEAGTWNVEASAGGGGSDESWYSDDAKEYSPGESELVQIRIAIPALLAGGVAILLGLVLNFGARGATGAVLTLSGGLLVTVATVLFAIGIEDFYGDAAYEWSLSFFFAIAACASGIVGGALGLVAGNREAQGTF
jgi:hypothetical protein